MARGTLERLVQGWSQPLPWLEAARNRAGKTLERLRDYLRTKPGRIAISPKNAQDLDDFHQFRLTPEEEEGTCQ